MTAELECILSRRSHWLMSSASWTGPFPCTDRKVVGDAAVAGSGLLVDLCVDHVAIETVGLGARRRERYAERPPTSATTAS